MEMILAMFWAVCSFGCVEKKPQTNDDCVVFYDTCNSGCEPVCGTIYEKEDAESGEICDLGCIDSGDENLECVLVGETCQFVE